MLFYIAVFIFGLATCSSANSFHTLFPQQNILYSYSLRSNVSTGTVTPIEAGSVWLLEGTLGIQVYDGFSRARFQLSDVKTIVLSSQGSSTQKSTEASLLSPWEVGACYTSLHVDSGPEWVINLKRALTFNFLVAEPKGPLNSIEEPCLYGNCLSIYSRTGSRIHKYCAVVTRRTRATAYEQRCGPPRPAEWRRPPVNDDNPNYILTAERDYFLDEKIGLQKMELKNEFQYKTHNHILRVNTNLYLNYENSKPVQSTQKLNLTESSIQYSFHNYSNPNNGIWNQSQSALKNKTYDILLKIARKGIDADNIVRNATLIHSLDFIELLMTMSQLDFEALKKLFHDVLGTSYELETSRNIFMEVLPYVRNDAGARLIRYLVTEQKAKIEDAMLVSLIRKLPYNLLDYNKALLEELEVFTKLGPEFPQEIRHAGILSFATLVYKTMEVSFDQQYFDDIYDKYLRMYNYCPKYLDRLIWLQGLTNIGKTGVNYLDEIYTDNKKDRHERLWAELASLSIWKGTSFENTLPILMNETEHIQLRIVALHAILSSQLSGRDFFNVHNYVRNCNNDQLKRFWYTTVKALESNRFYERYKSASYYIPFLATQLTKPNPTQWATNNLILSQEPTLDIQGPSFQLMTVGGAWSGPPELVVLEFSTGGELAFTGAIYIIAEGVTTNVFKRLQNFNTTKRFTDDLLKILNEMKITIVEPKKVHIDIILKIYDKTIYATHIDQERFDGWNAEDLKKSIEDFVRFGSHINQQIVYYPMQMVKDFPTELGTPIRLQSTVVSFTSLRGNLTAPSTTEYLTWRNDFHIRYQGTLLTSLSTDGLIHPSTHTARIQQSIVMHLPIKFDIQLSPVNRSLELKWTNPAQSGGIAMHSRTQIATGYKNKTEMHTVSAKNKLNAANGIYFDCENPMSGAEISQHLSSLKYNSLATSLQPSSIILNSLRYFTSPTAGSCGIILPPTQLEEGNKFDIKIKIDEFIWDGDGIAAKLSFGFNFYKELENGKIDKLAVKGFSKLVSNGKNGDITAALIFTDLTSPRSSRNISICLENRHVNLSPFNIDFTDDSQAFKGDFNVNISYEKPFECFTNDEPISKLHIEYENEPLGPDERIFEFKFKGRELPRLNLDGLQLLGNLEEIRLLNDLIGWPGYEINNKVTIKQNKGKATVIVNGKQTSDYQLDNSWLPTGSTTVQMLKHLGFYHECRVKSNQDIFENQLLIGDCTLKPRFAVILQNPKEGRMILYTGRESLTYTPNGFAPTVGSDQTQLNDDFKITRIDNEYILRSKMTGVLVYYQPNNETVILVPQPYMYTACGLCVDAA